MYVGRSLSDVFAAMMARTPIYMPMAPIPAIARPTIRAFMFGAPPHRALPASKMTTEIMYSHLESKVW
jgi:hypothetical protein